MTLIKVIYKKSSDKNICFLTKEQEEKYGIDKESDLISLKFGSLNIELNKIIISNSEYNSLILYLSEDVKSKLYIPFNKLLQLKTINSRRLEVGPIIGVFINQKKVQALSKGKSDSVYEEISCGAKKLHGISCFFCMENIDWNKKTVKALIWEDGKWTSNIMPLPMVIYDRCFGEYGHKYCKVFRKMLGENYYVINSMPKLAKLETIYALRKNPDLIETIPETVVYKKNKDIEAMLNKYTSIYLKPDTLYKGKGIYRISKDGSGTYKVEHRADDKNEVTYLKDLNEIEDIIREYAALGGGYLIQKEIKKSMLS